MPQIDAPDRPVESESNTELVPAFDPRAAVVSIDPERMWGTACLAGTRVPIKSLFDYLASGVSLDDFLMISRAFPAQCAFRR